MPTFVAAILSLLIFLELNQYAIIGIWIYWLVSLLF
jgi:hypothetical protein